jgi:folate-binding protein YgfZ
MTPTSDTSTCHARDNNRTVIRVGGDEAPDFLQALLTVNTETLTHGRCIPGALLTPQGRVLADMMIYRTGDDIFLECDKSRADDLFARLRRYRLRRPVILEKEDALGVWVIWNCTDGSAIEGAFDDPRHPDLGQRWLGADEADLPVEAGRRTVIDNWHALRIAAGVPQGPIDLVPERALMLEAGMDKLGAVDFEKGCYVGQEVTARTHYRGLVKRRIVPLEVSGGIPASTAAIHDGDAVLGKILSAAPTSTGSVCLAAMKLSDLHRIRQTGATLTIDTLPATLRLPDWMVPLPMPARTD